MPIKWVFFDVGDVLFNEDAQHTIYFHCLLLAMRRGGIDVEWDHYNNAITAATRVNPASAIIDAARTFVPKDESWKQIFADVRSVYEATRMPRPYGTLQDGITDQLCRLRERYQLGIIANQHPEVLEAIDGYGIGKLFDVKIIDQVVGVSKPDAAIFKLAFDRASCQPEEAIMVGDRPDNDIRPAKALGMRTVRLRHGILYTAYDALDAAESADIEITDVSCLADAVITVAR